MVSVEESSAIPSVSSESLCNSWNILETSFRPLVEGTSQFFPTTSSPPPSNLYLESLIPHPESELKSCFADLQDSRILETFESFLLQLFIAKFDGEIFPDFVKHLRSTNSTQCIVHDIRLYKKLD